MIPRPFDVTLFPLLLGCLKAANMLQTAICHTAAGIRRRSDVFKHVFKDVYLTLGSGVSSFSCPSRRALDILQSGQTNTLNGRLWGGKIGQFCSVPHPAPSALR